MMNKAILLIIDGLGDLPTPKTPLQAAKKPNFDKLAKSGAVGLLSPIAPYIVPGSDTAHLNILGYDPAIYYPGRGPLEALGAEIELHEGDVALRANFATIKNGEIIDRRAGRIATEDAKKLESTLNMQVEDVQVIFKSTVEHRGVVVLRGEGLSSHITDTDDHGEYRQCIPLDDSTESIKTAALINEFTNEARNKLADNPVNAKRKLPANIVLLRSPGGYKQIPSFKARFGIDGACVAGGALYKGIARAIGMNVINVPQATGDAKTNLKAKGAAAIEALVDHDFVFVHVKGCDSAGHDGDFATKKQFLERIDKELLPILIKSGAYIIITGDHSTPIIRKAHSGHPVPILVHGDNERVDDVKKFDEINCAKGGLGHLEGKSIVPLILNLINKAKKYGS